MIELMRSSTVLDISREGYNLESSYREAYYAALVQFINLNINATGDKKILTGPLNPPEQYAVTKTLAV